MTFRWSVRAQELELFSLFATPRMVAVATGLDSCTLKGGSASVYFTARPLHAVIKPSLIITVDCQAAHHFGLSRMCIMHGTRWLFAIDA